MVHGSPGDTAKSRLVKYPVSAAVNTMPAANPASAGNRMDGRLTPDPLQIVAMLCEQRAVLLRRNRYALLAVMENINVAGVARGIPIERRAAGNRGVGVKAAAP